MTSEEYQLLHDEFKKFYEEGGYHDKILIKLMDIKNEFYTIFDNAIKRDGTFITCHGKISYDELIEGHLKSWEVSRINGVSASLAFYAEEVDAILLIDRVKKEHFPALHNTQSIMRALYP